ncbi:universal stress protein [Kitasatospora sp. NPDC018058]|uniref:universal stress protein n=1 Tax=Kitasatospora sp. NPDC018058 TaxID=3364025 RepID=UPI0037C07104
MTRTPAPGPAGPVVVGTNGSEPARQAVLFALREAQARGVAVRAVHAYGSAHADLSDLGTPAWPRTSGEPPTHLHDIVAREVTDSVEELRQQVGEPFVEVEVHCERGRPAQVLLDASQDAGLLVVGSRGSGAWGRLALGSTSTEIVHHAHVPVVVVPPEPPVASPEPAHERRPGRRPACRRWRIRMRPEITVGLDGSPESLSAARWAAREAHLWGLPVRLLHLWLLSPVAVPHLRSGEAGTAVGQRILRDAESELREHYPDVPFTTELLPAATPAALLSAAGDEQLLALGSQDIGTGEGYLIGSLALYTVARSEHPVVLVRAHDHPDGTLTPAAQSGPIAVAVSQRSGYDRVLEVAFDAAHRTPHYWPSTPPVAARP